MTLVGERIMKKIMVVVVSTVLFCSCNNSTTLDNKADSLGKKVDHFSKKVWDSTKKEAKELKEKINDELNNKDSVKK